MCSLFVDHVIRSKDVCIYFGMNAEDGKIMWNEIKFINSQRVAKIHFSLKTWPRETVEPLKVLVANSLQKT